MNAVRWPFQKLNSFISLALVTIGLAASLAGATPEEIEDATLSLREVFSDMHAVDEADALNRGDLSLTFHQETSISNETMLGPVVNKAPTNVAANTAVRNEVPSRSESVSP